MSWPRRRGGAFGVRVSDASSLAHTLLSRLLRISELNGRGHWARHFREFVVWTRGRDGFAANIGTVYRSFIVIDACLGAEDDHEGIFIHGRHLCELERPPTWRTPILLGDGRWDIDAMFDSLADSRHDYSGIVSVDEFSSIVGGRENWEGAMRIFWGITSFRNSHLNLSSFGDFSAVMEICRLAFRDVIRLRSRCSHRVVGVTSRGGDLVGIA